MNTPPNYLQENKRLWNRWAELHPTSEFYNNTAFVENPMSLNSIELDLLPDLTDRRILHLQCHFGQDTLSLKHLGAKSVAGIDFSSVAIEEARKLSTQCNIEATFIESNVLTPIPDLKEQFDLVFASYGIIGWHPKAAAWIDAAFHYLKPGGELLLVDFHPMLWMLDDDFKAIQYAYFNRHLFKEERTGSYAAKDDVLLTSYSWNHSLSDYIQPIVNHPHRRLIDFQEYDWSPYNLFNGTEVQPGQFHLKGKEGVFPLVFSIKARKDHANQ